jgi:CHAD domain-containing protein
VSEGLIHPTIVESASSPVDRTAQAGEERVVLEKLLRKQLRNFTALFSKVLAHDDDADAVHDLRVCTRRLQQILSALVPERDLNKARSVRRTLRRVRRALGPWRNCDVALQWVARSERRSSRPNRKRGWELVRETIAAERKDAMARARRQLLKAGGITLTHRVLQLIGLPSERLGSVNPADAVRHSVADAAEQWREALAHAGADRTVPNIHAVRIQMKRLRYRVELARDLGADEAPRLIRWFKLLQDRLGHWHDRQELSRLITRALCNSELILEQPQVGIELLKEVEKNIKISKREVEQLFELAGESEGSHQFDEWLRSYCHSAREAPRDGAGSIALDRAANESASIQQGAGDQSDQREPVTSNSRGEVQD